MYVLDTVRGLMVSLLNDVVISDEGGEVDALRVTEPENPPVGDAVTV